MLTILKWKARLNYYRPKRSLAKVIFSQASVCPQGGGVWSRGSPILGGYLQFFGGGVSNFGGVSPIFRGGLQHRNMVNIRPVRILLECILVFQRFPSDIAFTFAVSWCEQTFRIRPRLRFTQLLQLRELIVEQWVVLYLVDTFALATGLTIAIAMQLVVHAIVHTIAIVEVCLNHYFPLQCMTISHMDFRVRHYMVWIDL